MFRWAKRGFCERYLMAKLGEVKFWKLNIKPGRPMAFGRCELWIVSAYRVTRLRVMVSYTQFARDTLLRLSGLDRCPATVAERGGRNNIKSMLGGGNSYAGRHLRWRPLDGKNHETRAQAFCVRCLRLTALSFCRKTALVCRPVTWLKCELFEG